MRNEELVTKITEEKLDGVQVFKPFYKNRLGLEESFRFGFELEAFIDHRRLDALMEEYNAKLLFNHLGFHAVEETTIWYEENEYGGIEYSTGSEIVTPILIDSEETWLDIKTACDCLKEHAKCTENCSVHINVGVQALGNNYQNWYNFLRIIAACEPELYRYFAEGKKIRTHAIKGDFRASYAMPIAEKIRKGLSIIKDEENQDINRLLNACGFSGDFQTRKDKSISLKAVYKTNNKMISYEDLDQPAYGRRIEIRMPNGTFDEILIQNYTYVVAKIFELARNLTFEKEQKLKALLRRELPEQYNDSVDISRVLDVANLLFDIKEDKLQFFYTTCDKEKLQRALNSREEALVLIRKGNKILEFLPEDLRGDRRIVLEAVMQGGAELEFASEDFKKDRKIVLEACKRCGRALKFADKQFAKNREIVLEAVKSNGFAIEYASEELKEDREIAIEAIKKEGTMVRFIGSKLRKSKEIAVLAVKSNREAIQFLDETIRYDKEILLIAYSMKKWAQELLITGKVEDEESFYQYMKRDDNIYQYLLNELIKGNRYFERYLLGSFKIYRNEGIENGNNADRDKYDAIVNYTLTKVHSKDNKELLLKFLAIDGYILQYLTEGDKKDREIVRTAILSKPLALEYADETLQQDKQLVMEAVRGCGIALKYASGTLKDDKEIVLKAIKNSANAIKYASPRLQEILKKEKEVETDIER